MKELLKRGEKDRAMIMAEVILWKVKVTKSEKDLGIA